MDPACAVVIPAYDMADYLRETIESVLAQDRPDWELVVVDDGSTDHTAEVAREFSDPRIRLFVQENSGAATARNRGMKETTAPRIMFLDCDDRLRPDALSRLMGALDRHPEVVAAYGEVVSMDEKGRLFGLERPTVFAPRPSGDVLRAILRACFIVTPGSACVRREFAERIGGFQEKLRRGDDWEFWCRLALTGPFLYTGTPPVLEYRNHQNSITYARAADGQGGGSPARDAVFSNREIAARIPAGELKRLLRLSTANGRAHAGRSGLKAKAWRGARQNLWASLKLEPFRPTRWLLLGCAWIRWVPAILRRRIK